jgi:diacylglycerol kinase (ATP)
MSATKPKRPLPSAERPPQGTARAGARRSGPSLLESFNFAFEGVIWVLRTQRNMRIHFAIATVVLILAFAYDVTRLELIALMLAIAFVLIAEMVNTAIEAATDIATTAFDPVAKIAKDIAAGAVLIASVNAVVIGYLVLADRLGEPTNRLLRQIRDAPLHLTVIGLVLVILIVIAVKAVTGRGTPLRGGLPSGHAALAFAGWMAITFVVEGFAHRVLVSTVAFIMACLVAQTRVEAGIHSTAEVALGAALGAGVTLALFQAFG